MASVRKIEKTGIFNDVFEVELSCGHKFKVDQKPSIRVGDDYKCPVCGGGLWD